MPGWRPTRKLETLLRQHEEACQYLGGGAGRDIHDDASNVILLGPPGVGKTHLAVAPAVDAVHAGFGAYFITAHDMVTDLGRASREGRLDRRLRIYLALKVLVIDEMGYLPLDDLGATIFFQLISARYERGSIIFTSNKSYGDWGGSSGIRSSRRLSYLRPAAAPLHDREHPLRKPSAEGAQEGRPAAGRLRAAEAGQSPSGRPSGENRPLGGSRSGASGPGRELDTPSEEVRQPSLPGVENFQPAI